MKERTDRAVIVLCVGPPGSDDQLDRLVVTIRKPNIGSKFRSLPSGRVLSGEDLAGAAARILYREANLSSNGVVWEQTTRELRRHSLQRNPHMAYLYICEVQSSCIPEDGTTSRQGFVVESNRLGELMCQKDFLPAHHKMVQALADRVGAQASTS